MPWWSYNDDAMNKIYAYWVFFGFFYASVFGIGVATVEEITYHWASDASASIFLDSHHFVVADDESNILRVYNIDKPDKHLSGLDLNAFLRIDPERPEADIEAVAGTGDRIYWITSHGRNKDGKVRHSRYRLFCTRVQTAGGLSIPPELIPIGTTCSTLLQQLLAQPSDVQPILSKAAQLDMILSKKEQKELAPKRKGLNIEGLSWHPDHRSLLIGLRNPLYTSPDGARQNNAIVIELKNPAGVIEGQQVAKFGDVLLWDLGGRAIRGMEYCDFNKTFYILAGPIDSESNFALYAWGGQFESQPLSIHRWPKNDGDFKPEGIAVHPSRQQLWVFSDDGTVEVAIDSPGQCAEGELLDNGCCPNKHLMNDAQKTFRIRKLDLLSIANDN